MIADYFGSIERLLNNSALIVDKKLDFMEYIQIGEERPKYSFNFSDGKRDMIFRYDNAPHHREIPTFPHHRHFRSNIQTSKEMGLAEVLSEIEKIILTGKEM